MKISAAIGWGGKKIFSGFNRLFIVVGYAVTFVVLVLFFRRGLPSTPVHVLVLEHHFEAWEQGSHLKNWKASLERALVDPYLRRIVLHLNFDISIADAQVLRGMLVKLKAQGKEVICYAQSVGSLGEIGISGYYLGSCANRFYLASSGHMMLEGMSVERLYFGKFLEALGVRSNFVAQGKYKSGPDGFTRSDMAIQEKKMMTRILKSWNKQILKDLQEDKRIKGFSLEDGLVNLTCSAQEAKKLGWVDALASCWDQVKLKYTQNEKNADVSEYLKRNKNIWTWIKSKLFHRHHIAILRIDGELGSATFDTQRLCDQLISISQNASISAVFIMLNTPGGTSSAAEALRHGVSCCRNAGKLTVIVMESVAASGGYWIACSGEKIWAQPGTLTGSIGVYAGKFDLQKGLKTWEIGFGSVTTGSGSSESLYTSWSDSQKTRWEKITALGYEHFLSLVAEERKMKKEDVQALAQGQVWTGEEAKTLGLVDELGDFSQALNWAKKEKKSLNSLEVVDYTPGARYSLHWILSMLKEKVAKAFTEMFVNGRKLCMLMRIR
ncbi:S49 family peptidase [Holospora undulata]|uniref:Protease 4 n=2 Tax=Holospora TaxID=44747 RepID=A0A061JIW2_9PROT|nr:S49 family peptidase [Holospora undulata]ETZ05259.1 protease 4 [Holospora undulata HU1]